MLTRLEEEAKALGLPRIDVFNTYLVFGGKFLMNERRGDLNQRNVYSFVIDYKRYPFSGSIRSTLAYPSKN